MPGAQPLLTAEEEQEWSAILRGLSGARDSIRGGQKWWLAHQRAAPRLAARLEQELAESQSAQRQLHLLWLTNDVLFNAHAAHAAPGETGAAQVLKPRLGRMLRRAYVTGGQSEEVRELTGARMLRSS